MHWELKQGCFVAAVGNESPEALQLISLGNSTPPGLTKPQQRLQSCTVDPEQNLLVLTESQYTHIGHPGCASIQFRSTLDGMPHRLAHHSTLTMLVAFEVPRGTTAIALEIMDHLLAVQITDFGGRKYEFVLLDWTSGILLHRVGFGSNQEVCSFVYLDKDHVLLASGTGFARATPSSLKLLVYKILPKYPRYEYAALTGPNYCLQDVPPSGPILTLEFPEIEDRYRISPLLFIRAGPIPGHAIHTQSTVFTQSRVPTLALSLSLNDIVYNMGLDFRVFVDVSRLFHSVSHASENSSTVIPWSEWGTHATRWFTDSEGQALQWDHMISGSRWLRITDKREHEPPYEFSVFDFNPRTFIIIRHAKRKMDNYMLASECEDYQMTIGEIVLQGDRLKECIAVRDSIRDWHTKDSNDRSASIEVVGSDMPTTLTKGFQLPVESRLPYRAVSEFTEICSREWTMDGEHIVGINVSWSLLT